MEKELSAERDRERELYEEENENLTRQETPANEENN